MSEGLVHVSSLNDDWYEYRSRQNRLVGRKSRRMFQLGDSIKVKILKVDILRNQIDLEVNETIIPSTVQNHNKQDNAYETMSEEISID